MAAWLVVGMSLLGWVGACGGPSKQAGAGESCFHVTDCELGLVCGPDQKCTSDLTAIDIRPDASRGGDVSVGASGGGSPDSSTSTASGGAAGMSVGAGGASAAGSAGTSSGGSDADAAE